ncbi:hypothetical protein CAOG_009511 [Capsaspora owczarzaki ATCC 30864]|uniref:Uncharacterized protein n=1 Tax=Capsaspora owczarzaki (strain ATCC 30864) TaxID=595528 RepID=A0A0D2VLJ2_CAPO3|nr:hypothetical protein CAOG_009511 [Capsaspora owczarzaki ATCC 30864]
MRRLPSGCMGGRRKCPGSCTRRHQTARTGGCRVEPALPRKGRGRWDAGPRLVDGRGPFWDGRSVERRHLKARAARDPTVLAPKQRRRARGCTARLHARARLKPSGECAQTARAQPTRADGRFA